MALAAITAGLRSCTVHLGHPERAWRAFSQWRSSWLSREGVAAVIAYAPALALACGRVLLGRTCVVWAAAGLLRSEKHTSELQSLIRITYAVFCLKKKTTHYNVLILNLKIKHT